ncbi:hypothetical protein S7W_10599 [Mycobacteroides abscessus M94]|nr:hypothetical protein S7W_10599 [Mycobacteroides abscessus M94]
MAVLCWMAALSYFDIRYRRLPNWLTLPAAVVIITVGLWGRGPSIWAGAAVSGRPPAVTARDGCRRRQACGQHRGLGGGVRAGRVVPGGDRCTAGDGADRPGAPGIGTPGSDGSARAVDVPGYGGGGRAGRHDTGYLTKKHPLRRSIWRTDLPAWDNGRRVALDHGR